MRQLRGKPQQTLRGCTKWKKARRRLQSKRQLKAARRLTQPANLFRRRWLRQGHSRSRRVSAMGRTMLSKGCRVFKPTPAHRPLTSLESATEAPKDDQLPSTRERAKTAKSAPESRKSLKRLLRLTRSKPPTLPRVWLKSKNSQIWWPHPSYWGGPFEGCSETVVLFVAEYGSKA